MRRITRVRPSSGLRAPDNGGQLRPAGRPPFLSLSLSLFLYILFTFSLLLFSCSTAAAIKVQGDGVLGRQHKKAN